MRVEIVLFIIFFSVVSAKPFIPGPKLKELLDDNVNMKGKNQTVILDELKKELGLEDVETLDTEHHLVLLPPNLVVRLCLQNDDVWQRITKYEAKCPSRKDARDPDVACMIGKLAVSEPDAGEEHALVGPAMLQCREWWRLAGDAGKAEGHEDSALGRCLLQALSTTCHPKIDVILNKVLHQ